MRFSVHTPAPSASKLERASTHSIGAEYLRVRRHNGLFQKRPKKPDQVSYGADWTAIARGAVLNYFNSSAKKQPDRSRQSRFRRLIASEYPSKVLAFTPGSSGECPLKRNLNMSFGAAIQ